MDRKNGYIDKTVQLFENKDSNHAVDHFNWSKHIYTPRTAEEFGAIKGDPFTGSDGKVYYTARYLTPEAGDIASKAVIDSIMEKSNGDYYQFASTFTGLPKDDPTVINYANEIIRQKSLQDYDGAVERVNNRNTLLKKKEELQSEFPGQEKTY